MCKKSLRFSKIYQKCKKLENRNRPEKYLKKFKKTIDKYPYLWYNKYSEREVIKMMVYVVTHEEDYDGLYTVVDAVFKTQQQAEQYVEEQREYSNDYYEITESELI